MSHAEKRPIATYNMIDMAVGLANFIRNATAAVCDPPVSRAKVFVMDEEGNHVKQARLEEIKLDDGTKIWNVVLTLDS